MIPPLVDDGASPGEKVLFERLRDDPGTEGWAVLHSLDIPNHKRQLEGEADFVVIVPGAGVACIEVKSHKRVRRRADGAWELGQDPPSPRGPFKQSSEAMHSLRERLVHRKPELSGVLFWSFVYFTHVDFNVPATEWHEWQVVDSVALRSQPVSRLVARGLSKAAAHVQSSPSGGWFSSQRKEPTEAQRDQIVRALRPEFELFQSPKARRRERDEELRRYTEDQYDALDTQETNERVIFEGAAGTGKTLLALEAARRESTGGARVLLCCYNTLLGRWMEREASPLGPSVTAGTFHKFMLGLTGLSPVGRTQDFWDQELPEAAAAVLLDRDSGPGADFDFIVVDEAQDLLRPAYLDVLDVLLAGGLAAGRWAMFGDFERQSLYGSRCLSVEEYITDRSPHSFRHPMRSNCRNSPRIAEFVKLLAPLDAGWRRILRPDNGIEPELRFWDSREAQASMLSSALDELAKEYGGGEVVVLSASGRHQAAADVSIKPWVDRLKPAETAAGGDVRYTSIQKFKGLEAAGIIVTDVDDVVTPSGESLLYVALTRATERLIVLASAAVRDDVRQRVLGILNGAK